jgi:DNA modification methylase
MKIELRPISDIKPYPNNPRINDDAVDTVAGSIKEFGFRQPIVVDTDGVIICGHTRFKAAQKLGLEKVPVHVATDLTADQIKAYRIADNKSSELADWNFDLLPIELGELQTAGFDLSLLGFDSDELLKLMSSDVNEGLTDPDDVPAPPDEAVTQPGDLWILGNHRLLCGDSSKPEDLDRLLGGKTIQLVNTDPPYNVKVEPRSNNAIAAGLSSFSNDSASQKLKGGQGNAASFGVDHETGKPKHAPTHKKLRAKDRPLANDFVSDQEFDRLLDAWFGNIARVLDPGRGFYIWGGYANCGNYPPFLKKHELYFSQAIIWDKMHPVLTRKDFMGAHEWCQPPDTLVQTAGGTSTLGEMRDDDRVVSFYSHSSAIVGLRDGYRVKVGRRPYGGKLYGITTPTKQSWSTDGHIWTVRMTEDYASRWCVYLMRRGSWWRVGMTKMRTTWGFGVKGRLLHELGDEAWILTLHDSAAEARMQEQLVSIQFGIPQTCWVTNRSSSQRQDDHIRDFYGQLDADAQETAACSALACFHRNRKYPFVDSGDTRAKFGARQSIQVRSCNLLPGSMEVPVPERGQKVAWMPIRAVDVQDYTGEVVSLGVDTHEHYIADGLVTHNCFYGWLEGAAHVYLGPNNATDLWQIKKVNPQSMVHLTEKPVELAVRAMQYSSRPGENVLDLFGGSGSTLIAAEQTGRHAFLMELDCLYADVIVDRYQRFTGKPAILERTGTSPIPMPSPAAAGT